MKNPKYMEKVCKELQDFTKCPNCKDLVSYESLRNNGKTGVQGCTKCN